MIPTLSRSTPPSSRGACRYTWLLLCALAVLTSAGCKQSEEVLAYEADKPDALGATPQNRILAALLFRDDGLWTFKLVGPESKIQDLEIPFGDYLREVKFKANGEPDLPAPPDKPAWIPDPKSEDRFAGFRIGPIEDGVEMTVVKLDAGKGDKRPGPMIYANINRWRTQLDLPKIQFDDAIEFFKELKIKGVNDAVIIDLKGPGSGKTNPAGMGAKVGPKKTPSEILQQTEKVDYKSPEGWREVKNEGQAVQSAVTLEVGEGEARAVVTITPLSGKNASDLLENVNRWRRQISLPEIARNELKYQEMNVGNAPAYYVDLTGTVQGTPVQTLVVVVPQGKRTWFIKMIGAPAVVDKQKAAFADFARSVKLPGGR